MNKRSAHFGYPNTFSNKVQQKLLNLVTVIVLSLALFSQASAAQSDQTSQLRQLAQLAEYIGVDYASAVEEGQVVNEDEYHEMLIHCFLSSCYQLKAHSNYSKKIVLVVMVRQGKVMAF